MRKNLLLLFLSIIFCGGAFALEVPALTGPVVDLAGVFNRNEEIDLSNALNHYQQKYGPQIQILTIPSLEGDVIENYSIKVVDQWKLGDKKREDGVLLLLALNDHKVRIEVGRGLEGTLTDLGTSHIIRQMTPYFKESRYAQGMVSGLSAIMASLGGELENIPLQKEVRHQEMMSHAFTVIFIILFILFFIAKTLTGNFGTGFGRRGYYTSGGGFSSGGGGGSSWSGGGGGFSGGGSSGSW